MFIFYCYSWLKTIFEVVYTTVTSLYVIDCAMNRLIKTQFGNYVNEMLWYRTCLVYFDRFYSLICGILWIFFLLLAILEYNILSKHWLDMHRKPMSSLWPYHKCMSPGLPLFWYLMTHEGNKWKRSDEVAREKMYLTTRSVLLTYIKWQVKNG